MAAHGRLMAKGRSHQWSDVGGVGVWTVVGAFGVPDDMQQSVVGQQPAVRSVLQV
jgi:hypothetical protein